MSFNEKTEHTANGWGPAPPGSLVTTHTANPPVPLWQCRVCRGEARPKYDWPTFGRGRICCGTCYRMGFPDTLERVR